MISPVQGALLSLLGKNPYRYERNFLRLLFFMWSGGDLIAFIILMDNRGLRETMGTSF
jgi:hypothetical protein